MSATPPVREVSPGQLRRMFRQGRFVERIRAGELKERIIQTRKPTSPKAPVPTGTESQIVAYIDKQTGRRVAIVHRYLLPDGTLGASGRPDLKWLFVDGTIYVPKL